MVRMRPRAGTSDTARLIKSLLCPLLAIVCIAALLIVWGWSPWVALVTAVLMACPISFLWSIYITHRAMKAVSETVPDTRGARMDWAAPFYEWGCVFVGLGRSFREMTLRHAALKPGERILDVGCGTGVLTRLAANAVGTGGQVVGIDPGPAMLALASRTGRCNDNRVEFKLATIEKLPFTDASFDVVLSSLMLHHLPPEVKTQGLDEVYRVLKPGGRLLAVDFDRPTISLWRLLLWPAYRMSMIAPHLRGEIPEYLSAAGFEPIITAGRWFKLLTFWLAVKPSTV